MSAKKLITKQMIIDCAVKIIAKRGMDALNVRALAEELGCSTRPVYLSFSGMDELKESVKERVTAIYRGYLQAEIDGGKYPEYKAYGMGYVEFARRERELFKYLFMRDRSGEGGSPDGGDMDGIYRALNLSTGLGGKRAERFHAECWIFVHGIATMIATGYLDLDTADVSQLLSDAYMGLKERYSDTEE